MKPIGNDFSKSGAINRSSSDGRVKHDDVSSEFSAAALLGRQILTAKPSALQKLAGSSELEALKNDFRSVFKKIDAVYLPRNPGTAVEHEAKLIENALVDSHVPIHYLTAEQIGKKPFFVSSRTLVVGDHDFMAAAIKSANAPPIDNDCYPSSIQSYLRRSISTTTVRDIKKGLQQGLSAPMFVKPKDAVKKFTGCVVQRYDDLYKLNNASGRTKLYCSPSVTWLSECRVFVSNASILGMSHYAGDLQCKPDNDVIKNCIQTFEESGESTAAYALDFGVLDNGQTALVEWNDALALGAYDLDSKSYLTLLATRWFELASYFGASPESNPWPAPAQNNRHFSP